MLTTTTSIEPLTLGTHTLQSRLIVGTGKYATYEQMQSALDASGADVVTVAVRRERLVDDQGRSMLEFLDTDRYTILPNTAGCFSAEDAVRVARLGRELLDQIDNPGRDWVKLEVLGDRSARCLPDPVGTLEACKELVADGFEVSCVTSSDDPIMAVRLRDAGATSVMPAGSPIGSGRGIANPLAIRMILEMLKSPEPPAAVRLLSPQAYALYEETFPGYPGGPSNDPLRELEERALERLPSRADQIEMPSDWPGLEIDARGYGSWRPLSLQPGITVERLFWYLALLLAFLVARTRFSDPAVARVYRWTLFFSFFALAGFGLLQWRTWNGKIYWIRETLSGTRPFGPYTNPIHFAGVMELAVPWMVGYAWSRNLRKERDANIARTLLTGFGALVCLAAGLAAASKMAALLLVASLGLLSLFGLPSQKKRITFALMSLLILVISGLMATQTDLGKRFGEHLARAGGPVELLGLRWPAWRAAGPMLADYPVAGTGFGTFREVFQGYRPPGDSRWMTYSHNDYLQVFLEGGIVGGTLMLWLAAAFAWRLFRRLRSRRPPSLHRLGQALGVASLAVHGLFDFNHQIPANALLFVVCAAYALPLKKAEDRPLPAARSWIDRPLWAGPAVLGLVLAFGVRATTGIPAGMAWADGVSLEGAGRQKEALAAYVKADVGAITLRALRKSAELRMGIWDRQANETGPALADDRLLNEAAAELLRAMRTAPASGDPWAGLSRVYYRMELARTDDGILETSEEEPPQLVEAAQTPRDEPAVDPWSRVGRPGRIGLGLLQRSLELAPNWYLYHDRLSDSLWRYELKEEAAEAIRRSARALPLFTGHSFWRNPHFPSELKDAFVEGSRSVLGQTGFLQERIHLVDLTKLERQQGRLENARHDLELARELPGNAQDRAEVEFHLGLIHLLEGDLEAADDLLSQASQHPVFRPSALRHRAMVATREGRHEEAYNLLVRSRHEDPDTAATALELAESARLLQRYPAAVKVLEELVDRYPDELQPYVRLGRVFIDMEERDQLDAVLETIREKFGDDAEELEWLLREAEAADNAAP